jgi:hypothetical protein
MITKFKIFENKNPDLRRLTKWVKCIKEPPNKRYKKVFIENNYYEVYSTYGDPERAINEFGINDYVPMECVSTVVLVGSNNANYKFWNNESRYEKDRYAIGIFWDYFDLITDEEEKKLEDINKYNL